MPAKASSEQFDQFRQLVLADRQLHAQLRTTVNLDGFVSLAVRLSEERGCALTAEELRTAVQQGRHDWFKKWI